METLVQSLVSGALTGSLYAMIGVGLTVVFGVMRIINLAHGEMVMLGMFGAFWGQALWRLDPFVSLLLWAPLMFLAGMAVYRFLLRPIVPGGELNTLLYTAGLSLLLANLALLLWSGDYRTLTLSYADQPLRPLVTVRDNLLLGGYHRAARAHQRERLDQVFAIFPRLRERAGQLAGTLSGGEQQMVAIGRGLMAGPRLLMLDEPSLGLAPIMVEEMFRVIEEINRRGVTVLLVEQNTEHALAIAHRGFVLESGRVVLAGTGPDLLASPRVREAYLGL